MEFNMKKSAYKRLSFTVAILYIVFFAALGGTLYVKTVLPDSFAYISGVTGGLGAVTVFMTINLIIMKLSPKYRKKQEIEQNDERNNIIRLKANALTFPIIILAVAAASVYFAVTGNKEAGLILSVMLSAILIVNVAAYSYFSKKG